MTFSSEARSLWRWAGIKRMHTQLVLGNTKQETKQGEGWREMGDMAQAAWSSKAPERRHSSEVREWEQPVQRP